MRLQNQEHLLVEEVRLDLYHDEAALFNKHFVRQNYVFAVPGLCVTCWDLAIPFPFTLVVNVILLELDLNVLHHSRAVVEVGGAGEGGDEAIRYCILFYAKSIILVLEAFNRPFHPLQSVVAAEALGVVGVRDAISTAVLIVAIAAVVINEVRRTHTAQIN